MSLGETDSELTEVLAGLQNSGDSEKHWAELYRLLWPFVFAVAYRRLGGMRDLAEDAAQEAFLRLARTQPFSKLADRDSLRAYLYRVTENVARDYRRSVAKTPGGFQSETADEVADSRATQGDTQQEVEVRDWFHAIRSDLSATDRQILEMTIRGDGLAEIAELTGLSYSNAGVRLHRLRARLRRSLEHS